MDYNVIDKHLPSSGPRPNLMDYAAECARFSWDAARAELAGLPGGALNIAHEAVGRHASGPRATRLALRWLGREGAVRDFTYGDLELATSRFANVLAGLGVAPRRSRIRPCWAHTGAVHRRPRGAQARLCGLAAILGRSGQSRFSHSAHHRPRRGAGDYVQSLREKGGERSAVRCPFLKHVLVVPDEWNRTCRRRSGPIGLLERASDRVDRSPIPTAGSRLAALHQRHDPPPQGRRARARGGGWRHHVTGRSPSIFTTRTCSGARPIRVG